MTTMSEHELSCMEVWSGHRSVENVASSRGLKAWIWSRPFQGDADGGDVHYLSLCVGGIVTRLVLADVAGHGSAVAETSRNLRRLLRRFMNAKRQDRLVSEINREFTELEQHGRFATAVVASFLSHRKRLLVTNAGHPRPLYFSHATKQWTLLDPGLGNNEMGPDNMPFGILESSDYSNLSIPISNGDIVIFYTDAYSEAAGADEVLLGETGLLQLAQSISVDQSCEGFGRALRDAVSSFANNVSSDDETLIVFQFGEAKAAPSVTEKLRAYKSLIFGQ